MLAYAEIHLAEQWEQVLFASTVALVLVTVRLWQDRRKRMEEKMVREV